MNAHLKTLGVAIVFASLLLTGFALTPIFAKGEDTGGTDDKIWIDGNAGGSGETIWREVHGFVIVDNDVKRDEEFNVTICENVKYDSEKREYYAAGHIFGELHGIVWTDDPEPSIIISQEDFDTYKEDAVNLTVYVFGEYINTDGPTGDELRQAYKEILVQRPNHAPKAKAMITSSDVDDNGIWDNWTVIENNEHGDVIYYIDSEGISVKFFLNASISTDQDGDNITEVRWDLDGDGVDFGHESRERDMNTTVYLGEGDHILGLIVGDGNKNSQVLDIRITVRQPIRYPDLTIQDITVVNKNGLDEINPGDRCAVRAQVKNIGDAVTNDSEPFDVLFEYWYRDTSPDEPIWIELGRETAAETISVSNFIFVEYPWDISEDFTPGIYSFRATADVDDDVKELREQNNVFPPDGEEMNAENVTVEQGEAQGNPTISIVGVTQSHTEAHVNELVSMNVTLKNTGDGDARYVDIYYYVDNSFQYYLTIDNLPMDGSEVSTEFFFSGDTNNTSPGFRIKFEVRDDGQVKETSDPITIRVSGGTGGGVIPDDPETPSDDGSGIDENLPLIIVAVVVIGGLGGAGFFFMRKKDEDVW